MTLLKDLVESKTMVMTLIFIMSVSLIGGINNNLNIPSQNSTNIVYNF